MSFLREVLLFLALSLILATCHSRGVPVTDRLTLNSALKNGQYVEWKGRIYTGRAPGSLKIIEIRENTQKYTALEMEIQGARNRIAFKAGNFGSESLLLGHEAEAHFCVSSPSLVAPNKEFTLIIKVLANTMEVYWNGELKFVNIRNTSADVATTAIRIYGHVTTERIRLLTDEDLANLMELRKCGIPTAEILVPKFCNRSHQPTCRVVNGYAAAPGKHPWQAAIRRKAAYTNPGARSHMCGATLIGDRWAVTAAHCFLSTTRSSLKKLVVRVGDYYNKDNTPLSRSNDFEASDDVDIEALYIPPNHRSHPTIIHDIALIKLARRVAINDFVKPICLPKSSTQFQDGARSTCGITGWGATNETQDSSNYPSCLQQARVFLVNRSSCAASYRAFTNIDDDAMLCAGDKKCGVDACLGDSGGPLTCSQRPSRVGETQKYTLWGITSFGKGCGTSLPGVYTRVTSYIRWMFEKMFLSRPTTYRNKFCIQPRYRQNG